MESNNWYGADADDVCLNCKYHINSCKCGEEET
jgi:hypothetical protein